MTEEAPVTKAELLSRLEKGWNDFHAYIGTLTEKQLTEPTDAAGWTVKDHIIHLAVWEDGIYALLTGLPRDKQMGVDQQMWDYGLIDRMNGIIQQRHKDKSLAEVLTTFDTVHQRLIVTIETLSDDDLSRPYSHYQSGSTFDEPVIGWIIGNTYEHYAEHTPWIAEIVKDS